jgi:hypothetical protein
MSYLGKTPNFGVRQRYYFTAAGSETSISGADDSGNTLVFTDGAYVDVMLNGVTLVAGTDYNTTTANTIGGLSALSASDIVEVVVYDIFTVAGLSNYILGARVPFTQADGTAITISLTADTKFPFTKSDGSSGNFSLTN